MASQTISPADRIRDLSEINAEVVAMLQSAGHAINSLTDRPLSTASKEDDDTDMEKANEFASLKERREAFAEHTKGYYTHLQAIVARLRRQAYALEEAGIIAPEAGTQASNTQQRQAVSGPGQRGGQAAILPEQEAARITNGGLGNLDVGWLNSRGNKVGAEKESELIEQVKSLLEESLAGKNEPENASGT